MLKYLRGEKLDNEKTEFRKIGNRRQNKFNKVSLLFALINQFFKRLLGKFYARLNSVEVKSHIQYLIMHDECLLFF